CLAVTVRFGNGPHEGLASGDRGLRCPLAGTGIAAPEWEFVGAVMFDDASVGQRVTGPARVWVAASLIGTPCALGQDGQPVSVGHLAEGPAHGDSAVTVRHFVGR